MHRLCPSSLTCTPPRPHAATRSSTIIPMPPPPEVLKASSGPAPRATCLSTWHRPFSIKPYKLAAHGERAKSKESLRGREHGSRKKVKSRGRLQVPSNSPSEFWDKLPKVCLTRRALREFDRRRSAQPVLPPGAPEVSTTNFGRFSRRGGPDLRHLRGVSAHDAGLETDIDLAP